MSEDNFKKEQEMSNPETGFEKRSADAMDNVTGGLTYSDGYWIVTPNFSCEKWEINPKYNNTPEKVCFYCKHYTPMGVGLLTVCMANKN